MPSLRELFHLYRRHLVDDVLAFWLQHAVDETYGGVLSCWNNQGTQLISHDKYIWSQGRWIWLLARLARTARAGLLDLDPETCLGRAERTALLVRHHALLADGSVAYVTDRAGEPKEAAPGQGLHISVFADLFVALGFAALAQEGGDPAWGGLAEDLLASARARIAAGTARTEPYPVRAGFSGFSQPMILVNVGTEVHAATRSEASAKTVAEAVATIDLFRYEADIREMTPRDPADADMLLARHRTPGHVLEACWFLMHAADLLGARAGALASDTSRLADLAAHACAIGWDAERGGLFRYVDAAGGEPCGRRSDDRYERLVVTTWDTKLWWPHAEALYALLLFGLRTGREDLLALHERLHAYVLTTFPAGPGREWVQIRDRDGTPLEATVALPVKDPFHVARALLLLVELLAGRS